MATAWGVVCASLAWAQPVDLSFEQLGTGLAIPLGRVGPNGEQWGSGWSGAPCASRDVTPDAGAWVGGTISRSEDYCWGWKISPSGTFFAIIKDRGSMTQTFTAAFTTRAALTWLESNRASWRNVDWYGRPNTYAVALVDQLGTAQDLGTYQSEVAGGNSWSTPPGDGWWTDTGKRTWQTRTSPPFTLIAGRGYTLRFDSLSPFWYLPDGGLGGVDDRTTFIDGIVLTVGLDAGVADAGSVDAGSVDAGFVDAGSVDAGSVDAGSVDAGSVDAGSVDAGSVDAGSVDAG
ncbi:MAG: hypothetical protein INH41_05400, partial [Myxococcaceae bacterium]|nr:hypothetical protein [Myxococcaceae bacterium]